MWSTVTPCTTCLQPSALSSKLIFGVAYPRNGERTFLCHHRHQFMLRHSIPEYNMRAALVIEHIYRPGFSHGGTKKKQGFSFWNFNNPWTFNNLSKLFCSFFEVNVFIFIIIISSSFKYPNFFVYTFFKNFIFTTWLVLRNFIFLINVVIKNIRFLFWRIFRTLIFAK